MAFQTGALCRFLFWGQFDDVEHTFKFWVSGTEAGRHSLWQAWEQIDYNGNGIVSLAEIDKWVVETYPKLNNKAARISEAFIMLFEPMVKTPSWMRFTNILRYIMSEVQWIWLLVISLGLDACIQVEWLGQRQLRQQARVPGVVAVPWIRSIRIHWSGRICRVLEGKVS